MEAILAIVDDIIFVGKLQGTAKQAGVALRTVRAADCDPESLRDQPPPAIFIDLDSQSTDTAELIRRLKAGEGTGNIPVTGFVRHTHTELQERAREAGIDRLMPRSEFFEKLPEILRESGAGTPQTQ